MSREIHARQCTSHSRKQDRISNGYHKFQQIMGREKMACQQISTEREEQAAFTSKHTSIKVYYHNISL